MDRHRGDEHAVEGEEGDIAVGAGEDFARGQPAAHRVENGGEMHGDRESQHEGGRRCSSEQLGAHGRPRRLRRITARLRPAIE